MNYLILNISRIGLQIVATVPHKLRICCMKDCLRDAGMNMGYFKLELLRAPFDRPYTGTILALVKKLTHFGEFSN